MTAFSNYNCRILTTSWYFADVLWVTPAFQFLGPFLSIQGFFTFKHVRQESDMLIIILICFLIKFALITLCKRFNKNDSENYFA